MKKSFEIKKQTVDTIEFDVPCYMRHRDYYYRITDSGVDRITPTTFVLDFVTLEFDVEFLTHAERISEEEWNGAFDDFMERAKCMEVSHV